MVNKIFLIFYDLKVLLCTLEVPLSLYSRKYGIPLELSVSSVYIEWIRITRRKN